MPIKKLKSYFILKHFFFLLDSLLHVFLLLSAFLLKTLFNHKPSSNTHCGVFVFGGVVAKALLDNYKSSKKHCCCCSKTPVLQ